MSDIEKGERRPNILRNETTLSKVSGHFDTPLAVVQRRDTVQHTNPSARVVAEFRTLSLQVTDTQHAVNVTQAARKSVVKDIVDLEWHTLLADEVCNRLGVSSKSGLDSPMVTRRLQRDGKNSIPPPPRHILKKIFWATFGGFGSLLLVASIICFIAWRPLGDPNPSMANLALAVVLLIVIVIQAVFNLWQDYTTGLVMASITNMLPSEVTVIRNGEISKVVATELVIGDLVKISLGCKVPADIRLIDVSSDLKFDRSILTGESNPVGASSESTDPNFMESRNIALQGTLCTNGSGLGVCVGMGSNTVFGRIAKQATQERPGRTTLEAEILRLVLIIASLAAAVVILIVILWAAWLRKDHPDFIPVPVLLINCVSVAVAFIPEGLPVCVTLASAMKKANILCKSLSTVESLGAVDVILSDKTGTLTQNRMTVVNVALYDGSVKFGATEAREEATKDNYSVKSLAASAGLCNDAEFGTGQDDPLEVRKINGDATDSGLLRFSESVHPVDIYRREWVEVGKLPFNSLNKFAIKLFRAPSNVSSTSGPTVLPLAPNDFLLIIKGAPDIISARCSSYLSRDGRQLPLDATALATLRAAQESFASHGQRVLLLAQKVIRPSSMDEYIWDDLQLLGLVALVDPPREDARQTVEGDFASTGAAIAKSIGIITSPHVCSLSDLDLVDSIGKYSDKPEHKKISAITISGPEMMTMKESQWKQVLMFDEIVFARTTPHQKLQIVKMFPRRRMYINDVPALKQADVGVAIAGGSEVATEAADLILLDKFSAIVTAIQYGRLCFENLRKSTLYLLPAGSFSELMPVLLNTIFGLPQALSSIQMIIICIFTDVAPASFHDLLTRKPRNRRTERLVDWKLLLHAYGFIGILESLTAMTGAFYFGYQKNGIPFSALWLKYGDYGVDPDYFAEVTTRLNFYNLVMIQWFNLMASRTRRLSIFQQNPLWGAKTRNLWLIPAMATALVLACFFSYVEWFQKVLLTRGINIEYYFLPLAYGVVILFLDETRKFLNRKFPNSILAKVAW
ncbi:hypothetical protein DL96DRAFT_1669665 [Flagelloscypha sp. PMI_526]|nr:hypothetical protein DL96DRAFT_1669665 [Flagelloscypha sp. PMI_526]